MKNIQTVALASLDFRIDFITQEQVWNSLSPGLPV